MCRLQTVICTINFSATKTFQWSTKAEITAIKLWRYDSPQAAPKAAYAMDITYRPARFEDLEEAERVVQEAGNELRVRHGRQPWPAPPPIEFPKFCLTDDPPGSRKMATL
jgi:hypothetical protein